MFAHPATPAALDASPLPGGGMCLPLDLMEEAVSQSGCRERRRRLLPAVAVMVFVLGCCLFFGEGYREVARKLAGWLSGLAGPAGWQLPGTSALAKARARLGAAPFELLFAKLAGPLADMATPGAAAFGRLLAALDGTRLDVPFTPANLAVFGPPPAGGADGGGFPQLRLVTVTGCGTRGIIDAVCGPRKGKGTSEQDLARQIAARGRLGPGMLVIADRNFCGYPVVSALAATGADVLIRAKSNQRLLVTEALPDGSYRSVLPDPAASKARHTRNAMRRARGSKLGSDTGLVPGIAVRVIEADITITPAGGPPRTEHCRGDHHPAQPRRRPRQAGRRLLRPAVGNRNRLPGNQGVHPRPAPRAALQRPRRHHPGNLGPAVRLPAHPHRPRRCRRRRRPRPRPDLLHRHPACPPPRPYHRQRRQHRHHRSAQLPAPAPPPPQLPPADP